MPDDLGSSRREYEERQAEGYCLGLVRQGLKKLRFSLVKLTMIMKQNRVIADEIHESKGEFSIQRSTTPLLRA
jgi:hypothetical protein